MRTTAIVDEPEIDGDAVIVGVIVEDPDLPDQGGVFVCRLTSYDDVAVETFPRGQTPPSEGESRVEAATAARAYATENRDLFDGLFANLPRE